MNIPAIRQPSAIAPVAMSTTALLAVLYHIAMSGTAPQAGEGSAAHIWQLLMAGQVPVVAYYAFKWLPQAPKTALTVLAVQAGAALGALAPVYWLGW